MFTKNNFKQRIFILEDGASGEQLGDIEENLFKVWLHDMKLMNLKRENYYDIKSTMNSRHMKNKIKFKIFKVMKLTMKIIFSQLLLRITVDDRFWRSHIDILY